MPDIASVVPIAPAAQTLASVTAASPSATADAGPDTIDFEGQLKAALKRPAKRPAKNADAESDEIPEALAALGLVLVPAVLQPPADTSESSALAEISPAQPQLTGALVAAGKQSPGAQAQPAPDDAQSVSQTPPPATDQPPPRLEAPPHVTSSVAASVMAQLQAQLQHSGEFQGGDGNDDHERLSARAEAVGDASTPAPASDPDFAATLTAAVPKAPAASAAPPSVHASEVVSQIAHQADLYRQPGSRGVRIQLHPDDLGGVQITVRYAASGGLELHINVEHAATGALVQAGWADLRDALATQGISPDRLVMSVTAAANASQLDFSSHGGGTYRSETGPGGFMQGGQFGQQREDGADDRRVSRGWNGTGPTSTSDENPGGAAPAAASRIDYRV